MKLLNIYKLKFIFIFIFIFFFSCISKPIVHNIDESEKENIFESEYNTLFPAIIRTLTAIGFNIILKEQEKGIITTDWKVFEVNFTEKSKYSFGVESGGNKVGLEKERARLQVIIKKTNHYSNKVIMIVDIEGRTATDPLDKWQILYTNGKMEKVIFSNIKQQLKY